jgi:hypothetical protein
VIWLWSTRFLLLWSIALFLLILFLLFLYFALFLAFLYHGTSCVLVVLDAGAILGLADLGKAPMPSTQCEKDTYQTDTDNYLDVCLNMNMNMKMDLAANVPVPVPDPYHVELPCTPRTQISAPKGPRYPCSHQVVAVVSYNKTVAE